MINYGFTVTDLMGGVTQVCYQTKVTLTNEERIQRLTDHLNVETMSCCEDLDIGFGVYRTLDGGKEVRQVKDVKLKLVDVNEVDKVRKLLAEQEAKHEYDFFIMDYPQSLLDEKPLSGEQAIQIVNKLKELAKKHGEPEKKEFEIWNETSSGLDNYLGESEGVDFKDACINYAKKHKWFFESFDAGKMTFYGSKLIGKIPEE
ncbi:hypothetical protein [Bacillus cereus]|uniref:hypothetical protein n=1 Tax=Bacillus cereus TaxID=1396 RepID=UPI001C8BA990|nr:hypothetical protein [Bacillus cereus]MBX9158726.1 hypothetical protein [Bacillus cereus]